MAGGAIFPSSAYPGASGNIFPNFYGGAGGNAAPHDEGWGVVASLGADSVLELRFPIPPTLPTGTLKLRMLALANATSGVAKLTVSDKNVAAGASPSAAALTGETQQTVTWAAGDNDKYKEVKLTLTPAPAGNDTLVVAVTFNTTGWTLAQVSTWLFSLIWE
ncbi:MAG TPA: hypothetical protein VKI17_02795 [Gemmataceae bacterium]|nr:hypothetical protein [Gemmataceae bacterium]